MPAFNVRLAASKTAEEFTKLESFITNFERRRDAAQTQLNNINTARSSLTNRALNAGTETDKPWLLRGGAPALRASGTDQLLTQAGSWPGAPLLLQR